MNLNFVLRSKPDDGEPPNVRRETKLRFIQKNTKSQTS